MSSAQSIVRSTSTLEPFSTFTRRGFLAKPKMIYLGFFLLSLQLIDGFLTYKGILTFGIDVEGNPLVVRAMNYFGVIEGLILVKGLAGSLLVGVLSIASKISWVPYALVGIGGTYLFCAVVPWIVLLNYV